MSRKFFVRLGITLSLLGLVYSQVEVSELPAALSKLEWTQALIALTLLLCVRLLMAGRMVLVAAEFDVTLSYARSVAMVFTSSLAGFVLPGGIGTDVVRGLQLGRMFKDPAFAAASVIVDRFLGVLAILLVGTASLQFVELPFPWIFDAFVYCALCGCIGLVVAGPRILGVLPNTWRQRPGPLGKALGFAEKVLDALHHNQNTPTLLALSLLIQACRCLVFLFTFYAFGLSVPVATVFALVPVLFIVVIAPISVGGLGVREGLLALLLVPMGYPLESVILVGFASHLLELAASLPGAFYLLRPVAADTRAVHDGVISADERHSSVI